MLTDPAYRAHKDQRFEGITINRMFSLSYPPRPPHSLRPFYCAFNADN